MQVLPTVLYTFCFKENLSNNQYELLKFAIIAIILVIIMFDSRMKL